MINVEQIYYKAQTLNTAQLQELTDFLDFLISKHQTQRKDDIVFPVTQLESVNTPSIYHGKPLSHEEMHEAIEWEAGQSS